MPSDDQAVQTTLKEPCPKCGHALSVLSSPMTMAATPAVRAYRCSYCGWLGDELDRRTEGPGPPLAASASDEDRTR
jgi:hypothetical protein